MRGDLYDRVCKGQGVTSVTMLRKLGLRTLLPVVHLAACLIVVFFCKIVPTSIISQGTARVIIDVECGINLPVLAVFFTLKAVFRMDASRALLFCIPFVPVLWYAVGLWIDRRLGLVPRNKPRPGAFYSISLMIFFCAMVLLAIPFMQSIYQTPRNGNEPDLSAELAICAWYLFLLVILAGMIRARFFARADESSGSSNS